MQQFSIGDHLITNIDTLGLLKHHGLYVGHGIVIHLAKSGIVCEEPLLVFSDNQAIRCIGSADDIELAVSRAHSQLGLSNYQLFHNNCEHFVNWCLNKANSSDQVSNALHLTTQGIARSGLAGELVKRIASAPLANIALASTAAKLAADYLGASKPVSTLIGTPGDLIAKPLETLLIEGSKALDETAEHLTNGNYGSAAVSLVSGSVKTVANAALVAPLNVAQSAVKAGVELGRDFWWWLKY